MIILHGDNTAQSRNKLAQIIDAKKSENYHITRLEAKKITPAIIEETIGSTSLFEDKKLIIIEELHSLPRSKNKTNLIDQLSASQQLTANSQELVIWEKRSLTKTMLKKFPEAKVFEFKTSNHLFKWLDLINGKKNSQTEMLKTFKQAIKSDGEFMCFTMLIRQIRLLITAKDGGEIKGPPFVVKKIQNQSRSFSLDQLLKIHDQLLNIDTKQKTSTTSQSLEQNIDLLLLTM